MWYMVSSSADLTSARLVHTAALYTCSGGGVPQYYERQQNQLFRGTLAILACHVVGVNNRSLAQKFAIAGHVHRKGVTDACLPQTR